MAPSHYLNQCCNVINGTLGNKLQWNLYQNSYIFIQENAFENVVWKMAAILSRPQTVNLSLPDDSQKALDPDVQVYTVYIHRVLLIRYIIMMCTHTGGKFILDKKGVIFPRCMFTACMLIALVTAYVIVKCAQLGECWLETKNMFQYGMDSLWQESIGMKVCIFENMY